MRPWKAILGVGAACAACCAIPLAGGLASFAVGASALAAAASSLLACAADLAPLAAGLLALAVLAGVAAWWRRRARRSGAPAQDGDGSPASAPLRRKACGCEPGACG